MSGNEKISKAEAKYKNFAWTRNCVDCSMFIRATKRCTLVLGQIEPQGTCKHWEKRRSQMPVEQP